jgi:carbon storage regulator
MLVLCRKLNEKIIIDGGITLTVLKVDGNRVKIGIEAPQDVSILRGELLEHDSKRPNQAPLTELSGAFVR